MKTQLSRAQGVLRWHRSHEAPAPQWLATTPIKDNCSGRFGALGILPIPADTKREALGVAATQNIVGGEHLTAYVSSYGATMDWVDQRLRGVPADEACAATPGGR
ncbi:hypothetical protein [Nocardia sp. NPDC004711]